MWRARYDGAALRIYVNGLLQGQTPYTEGIFPGTTDLGIGANVGGTIAAMSVLRSLVCLRDD